MSRYTVYINKDCLKRLKKEPELIRAADGSDIEIRWTDLKVSKDEQVAVSGALSPTRRGEGCFVEVEP
jgi:hypothetical protein